MKSPLSLAPAFVAALVVFAGLGSPVAALPPPTLPIAQEPLFRATSVPPLNMLVMGKDHKIAYEAYNDASDLNGDGIVDVGYKPDLITYYGYFNSKACYSHDGAKFNPIAVAGGSNGKQCSGQWSGDFLNYVTTARIDALRKVLYGGLRSTDTPTETVLRRAYVPQDAHSFGKEYTSVAVDGYSIASYAPLTAPVAGRRHLFANTTLSDNGEPLMRVLTNSDSRVWEWLSIERPVAGNECTPNGSTTKSPCVGGGAAAFPGHPGSRAAFNTMQTNFAIPANLYGSGNAASINCTNNACNPYGPDDEYLTIINGVINIAGGRGGTYQFRVNGDDAIDFELRNAAGTAVIAQAGCYGGRGFGPCGGAELTAGVALTGGTAYPFTFRHEEGGGGDGYTLEWQKTGGSNQFGWRILDTTPGNHGNNGSFAATPQLTTYDLTPASAATAARTDYAVRVTACPATAALREAGVCKQYASSAGARSYKPTGILHDYGEAERMYFGLITGTQNNNTEGGVLRRNVDDFRKEIDPQTGVFLSNVDGIVSTLDSLRMIGFGFPSTASYLWTYGAQNCPALGFRSLANGECRMWGNPIAEMMHESLRYFSGAGGPNPRFSAGGSALGATEETTMGVTREAWKDPYAPTPAGGGFPTCAKPFQTVISDINPSYDSGLPGSAFAGDNTSGGSLPAAISGFNASSSGSTIWNNEFGGARNVFIGQSGGLADGAPTAKLASSFGDIRGLAPEEPSKQGSYYSAAVAHFGFTNDIHAAAGKQSLRTFSVAVASPLPRIEFPIGGGVVSLVPFAKSVAHPAGCNMRTDDFRIEQGLNDFRATNTIVDFYVEKLVNLPGAPVDTTINGGRGFAVFRINYEDVEQGNDHDMDAIVRYALAETATGDVSVTLNSEYQAGSVLHHLGYVISGTLNRDGTYLVVRDNDGASTCTGTGLARYKLDTPQYADGTIKWAGDCLTPSNCPRLADNTLLPLQDTRVFQPGRGGSALRLQDPLWYAAKYGGFDDDNNNNLPDGAPRAVVSEWDKDRDGTPDNYFLVTNPATLRAQLERAFNRISELARPTGALIVSGARATSESLTYDTSFAVDGSGTDWTGNLRALRITSAGEIGGVLWEAKDRLPAAAARNIFVGQSTGNAMSSAMARFEPSALGATEDAQLARMGLTRPMVDALFGPTTTVAQIVNYLRGDRSDERPAGALRTRSSVIGDIVNSRPTVAGRKDDYGHGVPADASPAAVAFAASYRAYLALKAARNATVFVGANDGMLHAFNGSASGGEELFAFIPSSVVERIGELTKPSYVHRYYVDGELNLGDANIGSWKTVLVGSPGAGGKGVFALDVSQPASFSATDLLWELTSADNDNIGQSIGRVEIMRGEDDNWYAAFGNGFNSANGNPTLMLVDLGTGLVVRQLVADDGGEFANGLGQVATLDENFNGKIDTIYGGDLRGNLWKFDLSAPSSASWQVAFGAAGNTPLFTATDRNGVVQPVTGDIELATGPSGGLLVYFGTGTYFLTGDNSVPATPQVQTLYGVLDRNAPITGSRSALQQQAITTEGPGAAGVALARSLTQNGVDYTTKQGFYLDLVVQPPGPVATGRGERFVGTPRVQSGKVFFTTFQPSGSECNPGGINFLYGLDAISGAASLGSIRTSGPSGTLVCGPGCGGIVLGDPAANGGAGGAPVRETVMVIPPPPCVVGTDPRCAPPPRPVGGATTPPPIVPAATGCDVNVLAAGAPTLVLPRPCGRQSWRQVR